MILNADHLRCEGREGMDEIARINRLLASEQNLNFLLETILEISLEMLKAERGFILLLEDGGFKVRVSRNMDQENLDSDEDEGRFSATIAREAAVTAKSVLVTDARSDERFQDSESVIDLGIRAVLAVPMKIGADLAGVIYVDNLLSEGRFDDSHQKILEGFADQAALALRNGRQMEEIQKRGRELEISQKQVQELNDLLKQRLDVTEGEYAALRERYQLQLEDLQLRYAYDHIVGKSAVLRQVLKTLDRVTDSDVTVLIQGESGTGKELIARALHYNGPRKAAPFVAENCAAFSEQLLESELFGHKRGAFTGAISDKKGLFELAEDGTIFLDEIGELPPGMQSKLLRVLQERQIRAIGSNDYKKINARVIAATNRDLKAMVKEGKFREDLYYRINVVKIVAPTLRDRKEDIPVLVDHFLTQHDKQTGSKTKIHPKAMALLLRYDWPGNVRELANEIQRCIAMGLKAIEPESLSDKIREEFMTGPQSASLNQQMTSLEKNVIVETLKKYHYSRLKTAKALGVSRITLYKKMKSYGILAKKSDYARVSA
jgi:Nif-specific regulatory protein